MAQWFIGALKPSGQEIDIGALAGSSTVTTTKTLSGVSRIGIATVKTQSGVSRIQPKVTRTQSGHTAIGKTTTKTLAGVSHIGVPTSKTLSGVSRLQATTTKTATGHARIQVTDTKTLDGISRLEKVPQDLKHQLGVSSIQNTTTQTLDGVSSIVFRRTKTLYGLSNLVATTRQTLTGTASITSTHMTGDSDIVFRTVKTLSGKANIKGTTAKHLTGVSTIHTLADSYPWRIQTIVTDATSAENRIIMLGAIQADGTELRAQADNFANQSAIGRVIEAVIPDRTITDQVTLQIAANNQIQIRKPRYTITFAFDKDGLEVGELVQINSTNAGVHGEYVIQTLQITQRNQDEVEYTATAGSYIPPLAEILKDAIEKINPPEAVAVPTPTPALDAWQPNQEQANTESYRDQTDWTFGVQTAYELVAGQVAAVNVTVTGAPPENQYNSLAPVTKLTTLTASTGGALKGGQKIYLQLCASGANDSLNQPSDLIEVDIPAGTDTNTVGLDTTDMVWPDDATGWDLFAGTQNDNLTHQADGSGTPTNADLLLTGPLNIATYAPPDKTCDHLTIKVKQGYRFGCLYGDYVTDVTGSAVTLGKGGVPGDIRNDYTGLRLALFAKGDLSDIKVRDYVISKNVGPVFNLAATPDDIEVGDVVGVLMPADITSTEIIGCSLVGQNEIPAFDDSFIGKQVRIVDGPGKGQTNIIASQSGNTLGLTNGWFVQPDATSYWIVEEASWTITSDTTALTVKNPFTTTTLTAKVPNTQFQGIVVMVQTVAKDGTPSPEQDSPVRIVWVDGKLAGDFSAAYEVNFVFGQDNVPTDIADDDQTNAPAVKVGGSFWKWKMNALTSPDSGDCVIDILIVKVGQNPSTAKSIFGDPALAKVTGGTYEGSGTKFPGAQTIQAGDKLFAKVIDNAGAQGVTLQLYFG